mmetsp:Transcript_57233/g.123823  ORF Transcript_57233/g.123823 Transcript_57233/m.123823 type:complete len:323 (-) Transcript_57233:78-1046(-)
MALPVSAISVPPVSTGFPVLALASIPAPSRRPLLLDLRQPLGASFLPLLPLLAELLDLRPQLVPLPLLAPELIDLLTNLREARVSLTPLVALLVVSPVTEGILHPTDLADVLASKLRSILLLDRIQLVLECQCLLHLRLAPRHRLIGQFLGKFDERGVALLHLVAPRFDLWWHPDHLAASTSALGTLASDVSGALSCDLFQVVQELLLILSTVGLHILVHLKLAAHDLRMDLGAGRQASPSHREPVVRAKAHQKVLADRVIGKVRLIRAHGLLAIAVGPHERIEKSASFIHGCGKPRRSAHRRNVTNCSPQSQPQQPVRQQP